MKRSRTRSPLGVDLLGVRQELAVAGEVFGIHAGHGHGTGVTLIVRPPALEVRVSGVV